MNLKNNNFISNYLQGHSIKDLLLMSIVPLFWIVFVGFFIWHVANSPSTTPLIDCDYGTKAAYNDMEEREFKQWLEECR